MKRIDRRHYADLYGPTTGDLVRLASPAPAQVLDSEAFLDAVARRLGALLS